MKVGLVVAEGMASVVEIRGGVTTPKKSIPEGKLLELVLEFYSPPESFLPAPEGVCLWRWAGDKSVLVVELEPAVHTFRWIKDLEPDARTEGKPADLGPDAKYEDRQLALPYVVLVLPFAGGELQKNFCQAFYRRGRLTGWDDELLMTSLLNVAEGYGFTSWLCMVQYSQKKEISWEETVEGAVRYFLWSAFNRSSEVHEQNSHYSTLRGRRIDRRLSSAESWERASQTDPEFVLEIPWPDTGLTVRSAVGLALSRLKPRKPNLINLVLRA